MKSHSGGSAKENSQRAWDLATLEYPTLELQYKSVFDSVDIPM